MEHIHSSDTSARDSGFSRKRRNCTGLFNQEGLSFSHSRSMSSDELKEIIDIGNYL